MEQELYHHGIQGQRWGVRRYQNPDGSLTPAGKKRYDRNVRYRDALIDKNKKRTRHAEEDKAIAKKNISDLKKYGSKSDAYKEWKEEKDASRASIYDMQYGEGAYKKSAARIANDISDYANRDIQVSKLIDSNNEDIRKSIESSKKWIESNDRLMSMKVDALMSKRDIRKISKGA